MIQVSTDNDGYIINIYLDSGSPDLPEISKDEYEQITEEQRAYKLEDGMVILDEKKLTAVRSELVLEEIRIRRENECFSVMDRNPRFFMRFTTEQNAELDKWYNAWLEAPQTLIIPQAPNFIF